KDRVVIAADVVWKLEAEHPRDLVKETVEIIVHPLQEVGEIRSEKSGQENVPVTARAIDFTLTFEAIDEPVTLLGASGKGYGGLMIRSTPEMKQGVMTTESEGRINGDRTRYPTKWADLSYDGRGVAIFTHPNHPPHPEGEKKEEREPLPPRWLLRTSYAGLLNCAWPGVEPYTLNKGEPITLRYRIYVHSGDAEQAKVEQAYKQYIKEVREQTAAKNETVDPVETNEKG
ncbi:MAG: PmoA family protein, partial [Rhodospirillales bacterium]|nr:PmoA family protein [Rhodospirillales bacterium]